MPPLVTGGAGFIGSNLVRVLQDRDPARPPTVIDDFRTGTFANLSVEGSNAFSFAGRLIARPLHELDPPALLDELKPEVIFHQAATTDTTATEQARLIREHVEPFEALAEAAAARGIRLVWASSAAVYGTQAGGAANEPRPFRLEDAGRPANVYGFYKWLMENAHRRVQARHSRARLVGLRYFNVFGPGEGHKGRMASMVHQLAQQMLAGQPPRIFRDGEQARDQIYIDDVTAATLAAAAEDAKPGIYNIGTGQPTTFNRLVSVLKSALNAAHAPEYIENPYAFYQSYTCADLTATEPGLNWRPERTPAEAMAQYAAALAKRSHP